MANKREFLFVLILRHSSYSQMTGPFSKLFCKLPDIGGTDNHGFRFQETFPYNFTRPLVHNRLQVTTESNVKFGPNLDFNSVNMAL